MAAANLLYDSHVERRFVEDCASVPLSIVYTYEADLVASVHQQPAEHMPAGSRRLADLFGLLKAMELLETAWIRDNVDADDYQRLCQRLISQKRLLFDGEFKAKVSSAKILQLCSCICAGVSYYAPMRSSMKWSRVQIGDLRSFAKEYDMHVNRAIRRYDRGVPETMESLSSKGQDGATLINVTQDILEFKDAIFMEITDVDIVRFSQT